MLRHSDTGAQFIAKPLQCKNNVKDKITSNAANRRCENDNFQCTLPSAPNDNLASSTPSALKNTTKPARQASARKSIKYEKPYKCVTCSQAFQILENLTLHTAIHQPKPFRCPQCGKIFSRLASLDGHIRIHFKCEYFQCTHCSEMFHYEILLRQHMHIKHPKRNRTTQPIPSASHQKAEVMPRQHRCQYCGKNFAKNSLLERHERIHRHERPYACDKCGKAFTQNYSLVVHQLKHTGERPHGCPKCPQRFSQKTNLLIHMNRCHSTGDSAEASKKFACTDCSCLFGKLASLNAHISRCHSSVAQHKEGDEPATMEPDFDFNVNAVMGQLCDIAQPMAPPIENETEPPTVATTPQSNTASNDIQLADHQPDGSVVYYEVKQAIVRGVRTLICKFCDKAITRRPADMVRHVRTHTKVKPYECDVCGRRFTVKITLKVHMRVHDKNRMKSNRKNSKGTTVQSNRRRDMASEIRSLDANHSGLNITIQMQKPIVLAHDGQVSAAEPTNVPTIKAGKKFECYICHELFTLKFSLKQHIESHLGIKRYKCSLCNKYFGKSSILRRHELNHRERQFVCNVCTGSFTTANQLKTHTISHQTEKNVMCPYCRKTYKSTAGCRTHMKKHQSEIVQLLHDDLSAGNIILESDELNAQPNEQIVDTTTDSQQLVSVILYDQQMNENDLTIASIDNVLEDNVVILSDSMLDLENGIQHDGTGQQVYLLISDHNDGQSVDNLQYIHVDDVIVDHASADDTMDNEDATTPVEPATALELPHTSEIPAADMCQSKSANKYLCSSCPKSFKKPIDLRRHTRTHTGERPYQCDKCPKSFSLLCTLKAHLRTHATVKQTVQCPVCWRSFATASSLRTHTQLHTDQPKTYKCDYCTMTFRLNGHRKNHQQVHERQAEKLNVDVRQTKTKKQRTKLQPLLDMMNELDGGVAENTFL